VGSLSEKQNCATSCYPNPAHSTLISLTPILFVSVHAQPLPFQDSLTVSFEFPYLKCDTALSVTSNVI